MLEYQKRVVEELEELEEKMGKLETYLENKKDSDLEEQIIIMKLFALILRRRISKF